MGEDGGGVGEDCGLEGGEERQKGSDRGWHLMMDKLLFGIGLLEPKI